MSKDKEIRFLGSYAANTSVVSEVIGKLIKDLSKVGYSEEETFEIAISMDETISNAIKATIENEKQTAETLYITIRYVVSETEFDATIIDHGSGFDFAQTLSDTPNSASDDYHDQIMNYGIRKDKSTSSMVNKGISLKGIGAGLKIILNFMDSVSVDYIDKKDIIASNVTESTDGTIFNIKRERRNFS